MARPNTFCSLAHVIVRQQSNPSLQQEPKTNPMGNEYEFDPILVYRSLGVEGRGFSEGKANWNSA
jgi:hypothetical protein